MPLGRQQKNGVGASSPELPRFVDLRPAIVRVTVEQSLPGNLSMEDWQMMKEIIATVRQAIPQTPALSLLVRCSSMCCQR